MKSFQKWQNTWGWAGLAQQEGRAVLCLLLTSSSSEKGLAGSWENIFRSHHLNLKQLIEAPGPASRNADAAFLHNLVSSGQSALFFCTCLSWKPAKESALLTESIAALKDQISGKLTIVLPRQGHKDVKLRNALKKNHVSADLETREFSESVLLQAAAYAAELELENAGEWKSQLEKAEYLCLDLLPLKKAGRQMPPEAETFFSENPERIADGSLDLLLKSRLSLNMNRLLLEYMENGGSLKKLFSSQKKPVKEEALKKELEQFSRQKNAFESFNWEHPYSEAAPEEQENAALEDLLFLSAVEKARNTGDYEEAFLLADQPAFRKKAAAALPEAEERFEAFLSVYNMEENRDPLQDTPCVYVLRDESGLHAMILPEKSSLVLFRRISSLILDMMHQDPDLVPVRFSSVSRISQPKYERLAGLLRETPGLSFFTLHGQDTSEEAKVLVQSVLAAGYSKPPVFYAETETAGKIKFQLLLCNALGFVKQPEESGRMQELSVFFRDVLQFYRQNPASIDSRKRPGKEQICRLMMDLFYEKTLPVRSSSGFRPYLPGGMELSQEALTILADPSLSYGLTRHLAAAFEKGLKPGSVYYVARNSRSEREYQMRLRSLICPWLYIRRQQVYLQSLLEDPHLTCEEADFFMNPAFSLSKVQLLYEACQEKDPAQIRYAVHSSMSLQKMRQTIDALEEKPSASTLDMMIPVPDYALHPRRREILQAAAADYLVQGRERTPRQMEQILSEKEQNLQTAGRILEATGEFWNQPEMRAFLSRLASEM